MVNLTLEPHLPAEEMLDYLPHLDADGEQGASAVEKVARVTVDQTRLADA